MSRRRSYSVVCIAKGVVSHGLLGRVRRGEGIVLRLGPATGPTTATRPRTGP